ncbi:hypothetical protein [Candidatus Phytoplasma luffae]|nr:hypothetical protein [Candidatus Phytoplasma luffae]
MHNFFKLLFEYFYKNKQRADKKIRKELADGKRQYQKYYQKE